MSLSFLISPLVSPLVFSPLQCSSLCPTLFPILSYLSFPLTKWPEVTNTCEKLQYGQIKSNATEFYLSRQKNWCFSKFYILKDLSFESYSVFHPQKNSSMKTKANWLVSSTILNLQFLSFTQAPEVEVKWKRERGGECGKKTASPF